jgi:hypothetical protein
LFSDQIEASRKRFAQLTKERRDIADAIQGCDSASPTRKRSSRDTPSFSWKSFVPELMVTEKQ